jgi:hypothetical protein
MFSLDGGFDIPVMSRDIGLNTLQSGYAMMPMMPMPMYPQFGTQAGPPLSDDKFIATNAKHDASNKKLLRNALTFIGICAAFGFVRPLRRAITNAGGVRNFVNGIPAAVRAWRANRTARLSRIGNAINPRNWFGPRTRARMNPVNWFRGRNAAAAGTAGTPVITTIHTPPGASTATPVAPTPKLIP